MVHKICEYFFIFMLYSFGGWIMETLLYVIRDKHFVKRGFLYGPICPIYGTGAILCTLIFYGRVSNIFILFFAGALVTGALEYITHFLMEKLFHAMWWDYSNRRFNIKGRIYLKGLVFFGLGVVLIVKLIQPLVFKLVEYIPDIALYIICFAIYSVLIWDLSVTITKFKDLVSTLDELQKIVTAGLQKGIDIGDNKLNEAAEDIKNSQLYIKTLERLTNNKLTDRIHSKYPDFTLTKYKRILEIINDKPVGEGRTDIKLYGDVEKEPEE